MRPIKFRAWDNREKEYMGGGDKLDLYYSAHMGALMLDNDTYDFDTSVLFEQFTGLLDKNGKEIYEGDIVLEVVDSGPEEIKRYDEFRGVVVYERNGFGIQTEGMRDGETEVPLWGMDDGWVEIEVLGNIHENPELLEVKK
jgi:uncharacterized phage protein (TIGR01671 family)